MATTSITTTTTVEDNDEAFAKWEAEMHHSIDHDDQSWEPDGPTVEEWHRELEMVERERDYLAEKREAQLAKVDAYIDEFPF